MCTLTTYKVFRGLKALEDDENRVGECSLSLRAKLIFKLS